MWEYRLDVSCLPHLKYPISISISHPLFNSTETEFVTVSVLVTESMSCKLQRIDKVAQESLASETEQKVDSKASADASVLPTASQWSSASEEHCHIYQLFSQHTNPAVF